MSTPPHQEHRSQRMQKQQQRTLPNASAAVDAVLFLAGCSVSPHCGLRISHGPVATGAGISKQLHQQHEGAWLLLYEPSHAASPPDVLQLHAVTSLFVSLQQLVPR